MGFTDTTSRPFLVSVFGCVNEEGQDEETKQDQTGIMTIEEMFLPVRQMVVEFPSGFTKPYHSGIRVAFSGEQLAPTSVNGEQTHIIQGAADGAKLEINDESKIIADKTEVADVSIQSAPTITEIQKEKEIISNQYLKRNEESSSVEEPQLETGGEDDRVSKNDNHANLITDAGVLHAPNEGNDGELTSGHTPSTSANDGDTSNKNQQLLHKCVQAQKKKAKHKNQRPKASQRRSRKDIKECPTKKDEPELSVKRTKSIFRQNRSESRSRSRTS
ncbi:uncharacterized protein LOC116603600 [Nematostella vectensis]|uniref:uncharacterized protein LOC116603600 n=1 Tax=Nematostella vectensis TaxID=45351 RepID=UPI0020773EB8|nr:uncharacterized protein LOC116603600 [Nematostella vectensis]